jgi:hypothetical protein
MAGVLHSTLLPDPLSFTISTIDHLESLFQDRILPTLHYLMRALDFSDWPGGFADDMDKETMTKYYRTETRLYEYEWSRFEGFEDPNIRAYTWHSMRRLSDRQIVLLVILPPWILTPMEFTNLTCVREVRWIILI